LQALVLNWNNSQGILQAIAEIQKDTEIQSKLTQMQKSYNQFHSLSSYTQHLKSLLTNSFDDFENSN
ncbi:MAG: hypothetical protein SW833_26435, partial [Cyanobacteriota bacterium]|nr:hypothetical protein [Cyanobacteriota bacterium]